mgnify:CR=1 FL=1
MTETELLAAAQVSKAWPFEEARKLVKRYPQGKPDGSPVLFETGYGPSGLPHIGTFQEVLRTTLAQEEHELADVDAALRRIDAGTYGICEATSEPITAARLRAIPWTRLSKAAAELAEHTRAAGI